MVDTQNIRYTLDRITGWKREALLDNTTITQLNESCWHYCPDCGVGGIAKKNGGRSMDYDILEQLAGELTPFQKAKISLQYMSDPFNYESQGHGIRDAHNLFGGSRKLITAVPPGKEDEVLRNLDIIGVITVHDDRRDAMAGFLNDLVKELQNNPEYKIRVVDDSGWMRLGPQHVGNLSPIAMHHFHGVVITPTQLYSQRVVKPSEEHPYGAIKTPVDPDDFRIAALAEFPHYALPPDVVYKYNGDFLRLYHEIDCEEAVLKKPFNDWLFGKYTFIRSILLAEAANPVEPDKEDLYDYVGIMFDMLERAKSRDDLNEFERQLMKDLQRWFDAGVKLYKKKFE